MAGLLAVGVLPAAAHAQENGTSEVEDVVPVPPRERLKRAFDKLYDYDLRSRVSLRLGNSLGEGNTREVEVARKWIDGRLHSLGRFTGPIWLRGTTVLVIENEDRSDDQFVYLPEMRKVRRVTAAQQTDAFMGTDLWYEDLSRRRVEDYEIESARQTRLGGETVTVFGVRPRERKPYARVEFVVADQDDLILETRFYRGEEPEAFKTISARRASLYEQNGHQMPTELRVENRRRGTSTEVVFSDISINPELEDALFRAKTLQTGAPIPGWERSQR